MQKKPLTAQRLTFILTILLNNHDAIFKKDAACSPSSYYNSYYSMPI